MEECSVLMLKVLRIILCVERMRKLDLVNTGKGQIQEMIRGKTREFSSNI